MHLSSRPEPLSSDHVAPNSSDPPRLNTPASEKLFAAPPMLSTGRYQAFVVLPWTKNSRLAKDHTCESVDVVTPVMAGAETPVIVVHVAPSNSRALSAPFTA